MNRCISRAVFLLLIVLAAVTTISCTSGAPTTTRQILSSSAGSRASDAANDYTKPYLTDEKLRKLIASMKEEHNPFEVIFKQGGQMRNPLDVASKMGEFNSFARKYGFDDYQDYTTVWGRVMVGETQLWGEESLQQMISSAQAELKKPDLNPEMRKIYEDQVASTQKSLDEMHQGKSGSSLNASDLELVKKYKDQVDAAEKKYNAGQ